MFEKELANRCSLCGKFYAKTGRHTRCSVKPKTSKRQEELKRKFEKGEAQQCKKCGLYFSGRHNRGSGTNRKQSEESGTMGNGSELNEAGTVPEVIPVENASSEYSSDILDALGNNVRKKVHFSPSVHDEDPLDAGNSNQAEQMDEVEALIRGLLFPTDDDIQGLHVDAKELEILEAPETWTESTTLSCFACLLQ